MLCGQGLRRPAYRPHIGGRSGFLLARTSPLLLEGILYPRQFCETHGDGTVTAGTCTRGHAQNLTLSSTVPQCDIVWIIDKASRDLLAESHDFLLATLADVCEELDVVLNDYSDLIVTMSRLMRDNGNRTSLDEVLGLLDYDRETLAQQWDDNPPIETEKRRGFFGSWL